MSSSLRVEMRTTFYLRSCPSLTGEQDEENDKSLHLRLSLEGKYKRVLGIAFGCLWVFKFTTPFKIDNRSKTISEHDGDCRIIIWVDRYE